MRVEECKGCNCLELELVNVIKLWYCSEYNKQICKIKCCPGAEEVEECIMDQFLEDIGVA